MIVDAAVEHVPKAGKHCVPVGGVAGGQPVQPEGLHERRIGEFGRAAQTAFFTVDHAENAVGQSGEAGRFDAGGLAGCGEPRPDMVGQGIGALVNAFFLFIPGAVDRFQHLDEARTAISRCFGKYVPPQNGFASGVRNMVSGQPPCSPVALSAAM